MCEFIIPLLTAIGGGGAATAAGATAAAATAGAAGAGLATVGTVLAIGGSLYQGIAANRAAKENAALIDVQKQNEARLNGIQDVRSRRQFRSQIRQQFAELASRGVDLDSPTAVLLGQEAAREMSFNSQAIRSTGQARQTELTANQRTIRARGRLSLLQGGSSAAGILLNAAPDLWPELEAA